jgi:hypothetical protein
LQTFQNIMDNWQCRLRRCIQLEGEYLLDLKKEIQKNIIFCNFDRTVRTSGPRHICSHVNVTLRKRAVDTSVTTTRVRQFIIYFTS